MPRIILTIFLISFTLYLKAQSAGSLEVQAYRTAETKEKMILFFKAGEKYLGADPKKASQMAHQAYSLATEINDNTMAYKAAYLNAEGYARQQKWGEAKFRYNRGKESASQAKDTEGVIRCLNKMTEMARREGNNAEAEMFSNQAKELRNGRAIATNNTTRPNTEGGSTTTRSPTILSTPVTRNTPTNQAEMNSLKEQFRRQAEQLEQDRQRLLSEVEMLKREKESYNSNISTLKEKEKNLSLETEQAKQEIAEKSEQLAMVEKQKLESDKVAIKKQKLVEALRNGRLLDSIAYAQEHQEQELALQKSHNFRNVLLLVLGFSLILIFLIYKRYLENQKQKKLLVEKNREVENEKQRSEELLLNILPAPIAQELKLQGKAQAQHYSKASVLFADFKNFSNISEKLTPEQLVYELDTYFKAFDFIISQYKLEKIKTIGDAYMCASGLSDNISSPISLIRAAMEIQQYIYEMKMEKMRLGEPYFEARIGVHTGPVVAGVVGVNKFAYDIWGDTVNIAARVQEAGEPMYVNISEATYQEVQYAFNCYYRGKLPAKNKGYIDMYFIEGIRNYN